MWTNCSTGSSAITTGAESTIFAGVIGIGCMIGLRKMMRISHPINEAELEHTVNWHFSVDGLQAANDRVLQLTSRLELPNLSRRSPDRLHTSSDGQKFEVRVDSLNANYSYKYFGKGQGVSVYTFRDERDLLWYSTVFSSADRESAYVIDGLMHNEVVKSDIHSTDTFGFSELVFGVSHLLGFSYAPRFKNLKRQRLYIFKSRRGLDRSAWKIKPTGYIDDELAIQHWDDILRLIATIKLKEVTASDLFRRLNSYSKQHALYHALKAFGQIPKSLFILRLIDDPALRQAIEKQLDRIEHAHRFTRAVSVGNPREFLQAEKEEQEMAEACKRLIKNCIICWNYLYLSQKLKTARTSPVEKRSWRQWPTAQRSPGSTSICSANMISQTKSCRIPSESNPQNWRTKGTHFWEVRKGQNSKAGTVLDKILFRIWYLCWNLTIYLAWKKGIPVDVFPIR
jgi:TnpA family transposase